jgi:CBS domain-containing protein
MNTVAQLLALKGNKVFSVEPTSTVYDAIKTMADHNVGALAVTASDRLVGIFSERDYARKVILRGKASPTTSVAEIMTENPVCVNPDQTVEQCMALMTSKAIRHLPVLEDDRLVGMISIGDLVKSIIEEQEFIIDQLGRYIQGH